MTSWNAYTLQKLKIRIYEKLLKNQQEKDDTAEKD